MKSELSQAVLRKWGVYKIINIINGDIYIGSTTESFKKRVMYKHISDYYHWLNYSKRSCCPILYNAFKKYGIDNFKLEVLVSFIRKKDAITTKKIAVFLESRFIKKLVPKYNICEFPEIGGCPNLGRKLDDVWKQNISNKSKLYKHSNNQDVYLKKKQQNKDLSSLYKLIKDDFEFIGSAKDCAKVANVANIFRWKDDKKSRYGWRIKKINSQKKCIKLFLENEEKLFNSFGECDKFLNMWRGYTSTQIVNNKDRILDYKYEL